MGELVEQLRPESLVGIVATALVVIVLVPVLVVHSPEALVVGVTLAFLAWLVDRSGVVDGEDPHASPTDEDALDRLRRRYAEGELTDREFERRLDRLLDTETLEDATRRTLEDAERQSFEDAERRSFEDGERGSYGDDDRQTASEF